MILVTGGTGLVGAQLLFDLTASGQRVRALRRETSSNAILNRIFLSDQDRLQFIEWVNGDVNDLFSLEDAFHDIQTVYHCAAYISFDPVERSKMQKINVTGTANMVNLALDKKIKQFCHLSSVAALGRSPNELEINENNQWKTSSLNSNYAITKYGAEREVWRGIEEGLNAVIINPSIILGPGNWLAGSSQIFSNIYNGLPFYTNGKTGFVDVRDVSRCAIGLLQKQVSGERFIISAENLTYKEIFFEVADCFNKKRPSIEAKPWMANLVWRLHRVLKFILRKKGLITKETAQNSMESWHYSNTKILSILPQEFIPIKKSIADTCSLYSQ